MKIKIQFTIDVDVKSFMEDHNNIENKKEAVEYIRSLVLDAGCSELIVNGFMKQELDPPNND